MSRKNPKAGFTLLELVVVLAILAVVATLATREISHIEEQRRFEVAQQGLEAIRDAVLGAPGERLPDGTPGAAGFLADMGRLPRTAGTTNLTLAELWIDPGVPFDVRPATTTNGVDAADADPQVLVPGGWRGPYLRLPAGTDALRDGWGNDYRSLPDTSPSNPLTSGYARLRDADDTPLTSAGSEIAIVRHLGANGTYNVADTGYDRDVAISFTNDAIRAGLRGHVEVLDDDGAAGADSADSVTIRVFGPDPDDAAQIEVWQTAVAFTQNPVIWEIPVSAGLTAGPRIVRAYFTDANGNGTTLYNRSAVTRTALRSGMNPLDLTIDRRGTP